MAQVKLLKIAADGVPVEFASATDDITLNSFAVQGGGPVLSPTGLDLNNQDVSDIQDLIFVNPATATLNQTAGNVLVDDLMAKDRDNVMALTGAILFGPVADSAAELDAFKLPVVPGAPSATPAHSADAGYMVYDGVNKNLYLWDGSAWDNLNSVRSAQFLDDEGYTASAIVAIRDAIYISGSGTMAPASAAAPLTAQVMGFALVGAAISAPLSYRSAGRMSGFSGLTPTARYFLSAVTPGAITPTIPAGAGNSVIQVGYAKSATELEIQFDSLGRRAS